MSCSLRNTRLSLKGVVELADAMEHNSQVETIRFSETTLSMKELRRSDENPSVSLDLASKNHSVLDVAFIATMIHHDSALEFLNLSENSLCGPKGTNLLGFQRLTQALDHRNSVLTTLILQRVGLRSDGLLEVVKVMLGIHHLRELDLSKNPLSCDGANRNSLTGFKAFCKALRRNVSIQTLV